MPDEGSVALDEHVKTSSIRFQEAMEQYDVVSAVHDPENGSYIVMAEKASSANVKEMGYTAPSPFTSWTRQEHVSKLRDRMGIQEYYRMKRADGIIRGALRLLKTPIQAARWYVKPASDSTRDKNVAKFVEDNLMDNLNVTWDNLLDDVLLMIEYGYMPFEKVYKEGDGKNKGKVLLKKLAPRHPLDIQQWEYDKEGGPDGLIMEPNPYEGIGTSLFIPISKLVVFSLEAEAGDITGISVLRSVYKHYYYKDTLYKIDAIQKERHGIGIPIIKLPIGYKPGDLAVANDLGRNLRTNERAHIVLPPNWDVLFAKLEGQPVDCMKSIEHHNMQIMANILAPFMTEPKSDPKSLDMFLKSTRYIAKAIAGVFNKHVIPELVNYNFERVGIPTLVGRRIGEWEDIRTMSFALRNLVGAGIVTPDEELEKNLRDELDLPAMDPATARVVRAPQLGQVPGSQVGGAPQIPTPPAGTVSPPGAPTPPTVGPPRQATSARVGVATAGAGGDRSGGK